MLVRLLFEGGILNFSCANLPFGRVFKIHNFFCMIFDRFIKIFYLNNQTLGFTGDPIPSHSLYYLLITYYLLLITYYLTIHIVCNT